MSSASIPFLGPKDGTTARVLSMPKYVHPRSIRRRPDMQQGKALEVLGHAIEYLQDSRMFLVNNPECRADSESVQLLARLSREVFATCPEVVSVRRRLKLWAVDRLGLQDNKQVDAEPFHGA